jgi:amino acid efflux transporter
MVQPQLRKSLTWVQGSAMAVGAVLGSGVLILPAITAEQSGPASILAWVWMSLLSLPLALTIGRLGAQHPHAGGIVQFARLAYGPIVGRVTAWLFLGTIPIGVPSIALVGASYVAGMFALPTWTVSAMAALMLAVSLHLHRKGVETAGWVQVLVLSLTLLLILVAVVAAAPHVKTDHFHPFVPHGWRPVFASAVEIFWCFVGWEMVAHLAEEFRDPVRDLRRTFILAPFLVGGLYVAVSLVTVGTHVYGREGIDTPLSELAGIGLGEVGRMLTGIVALLVTMAAIHGNVAGFSRMVYSQARDGVFPAFLARLHPRYHTPVAALYILGIDFFAVLVVYTVFQVDLGSLVKWPSVVFLVIYLIAMASALRLLKETSARALALVPLAVCAGLYPFSGWAMLYPAVLAGVGWLMSRRSPGEIRSQGGADAAPNSTRSCL